MSEQHIIQAEKRVSAGKGAARAIRRRDFVPCVIYGGNKEPSTISIDHRLVMKGLHTGHFFSEIYDIVIDDDTKSPEKVLVRDVSLHPVTDRAIHVDFLRVSDKTVVTVSVPVKFINEDKCIGLKTGGTLNIIRHDVELICKAGNIPSELICDLETAQLGDSIKFSFLPVYEGSEPVITDRDFVICNIAAPRGASETEETEETGDEGEEASEE